MWHSDTRSNANGEPPTPTPTDNAAAAAKNIQENLSGYLFGLLYKVCTRLSPEYAGLRAETAGLGQMQIMVRLAGISLGPGALSYIALSVRKDCEGIL